MKPIERIAEINRRIDEFKTVIRELEAKGQGEGPAAVLFRALIAEKVKERQGIEFLLGTGDSNSV